MSEENGFSWTVKADLPAARHLAASIVHQGRLWLIGGKVNWVPSSSVAIYDIDADSWGAGPALPRGVFGGRATTLNGDVYFTSGEGTWAYTNAAWEHVPGCPGAMNLICASVILG